MRYSLQTLSGLRYARKLERDLDQIDQGLNWVDVMFLELNWECERMLQEPRFLNGNAPPGDG